MAVETIIVIFEGLRFSAVLENGEVKIAANTCEKVNLQEFFHIRGILINQIESGKHKTYISYAIFKNMKEINL